MHDQFPTAQDFLSLKLVFFISQKRCVVNTTETTILCSFLYIGKNKDDNEDQLQIIWATRGNGSFFRTLSPLVKNGAGLQMKMGLGDANNFQKYSQIYPLKNLPEREAFSSYLVMRLGAAPVDLLNKWKPQNSQTGTVSGRLSLNMVFNEEFLTAYFVENAPMDHCRSILAKMLENTEWERDTTITSAGEATVKCHRAVLVASNPYFQAMFQSGMWESITNAVNMTDMMEVEVRSFLGYLYICVIEASFGGYPNSLETLMIRGKLSWLLFGKNFCGISRCAAGSDSDQLLNGVWNDLSLKAVQVLKWYSKERPLELMASDKYKKLYVETSQVAMELDSKFLQYLDTDEIEKGVNNGERNFIV